MVSKNNPSDVEAFPIVPQAISFPFSEKLVWLIPETLAKTNLSAKNLGDLVNIEVDVIAKYIERLTKRDN
jgi:riboflavin synthase alpha subunit